ncbi:MAG: CobW family GTP-binding protein [Geminicoccaceae bacterium]
MKLIPLSILTGFLGAGKTTLLNRLVQLPEMQRTAVVINEFGEIGLDHMLVEKIDENIVQIDSGCLCCTVRGDVIESLDGLAKRVTKGKLKPFDRVIIETTGLADPAPIIHTLMNDPKLLRRYRLESIVTLIDAVNGMATLDAHPEALKQAAVADRLVLTKTDLLADRGEPGALCMLRDRLKALNPGARVLDAANGQVTPANLFDATLYDPASKQPDVAKWLAAEAYDDSHAHDHGHHDARHDHHHHDVNRHDDHIRAYCITRDAPIRPEAFEFFLQLALSFHGENLLRMKGILNIEGEDGPAVIHGVQHVFHPVHWLDAWPDPADKRSKLVCITRDIPRAQLEQLFDAMTERTPGLPVSPA